MPSAPLIDHVTITASDFAASSEFYEAALAALGMTRLAELVDEEEEHAPVEAAGWGPEGESAFIWLISGDMVTAGLHIRLRTESRVNVETFFAAALAAGGERHSAPRRWTPYRRGEFHAIVRDPDGNLIEAVAAE